MKLLLGIGMLTLYMNMKGDMKHILFDLEHGYNDCEPDFLIGMLTLPGPYIFIGQTATKAPGSIFHRILVRNFTRSENHINS